MENLTTKSRGLFPLLFQFIRCKALSQKPLLPGSSGRVLLLLRAAGDPSRRPRRLKIAQRACAASTTLSTSSWWQLPAKNTTCSEIYNTRLNEGSPVLRHANEDRLTSAWAPDPRRSSADERRRRLKLFVPPGSPRLILIPTRSEGRKATEISCRSKKLPRASTHVL